MANPKGDDEEKVDEEECAICSTELVEEFSRPEPCYHRFHSLCIKTWSAIRLTCPMCRESFKRIFTYSLLENKAKPKLTGTEVFEEPKEDLLEQIEMTTGMNPYDFTVCRICGGGDNEHQILLCDGCDEGFHMYCLPVPLERIPTGRWYCSDCSGGTQRERRVRGNHSIATRTAEANRIADIVVRQLNLCDSDSSDSDDYSALDDAVLAAEPGSSSMQIPPIVRRRKHKGSYKGPEGGRKRRRRRRRTTKIRRNIQKKEDFKLLRNFPGAELAHLSINGAGSVSQPYFEDDFNPADIPPPASPGAPTPPPRHRNYDLLGSIIHEQEKVLADGRLFKVEGGKFCETEEYEKYRDGLHKTMDNTHRRRLGMSVEEERKKLWDQPSSSNTRENEDKLLIDETDIDPEVQDQMYLASEEAREEERQRLHDLQRQALAEQKREDMLRRLEEGREQDLYERTKKQQKQAEEEKILRQKKAQMEADRRARKEREKRDMEEKRAREKEKKKEEERREEERKRDKERDAKAKREEAKRAARRKEHRRSRSRSPRERKDDRREDRSRDSKDRREREDRRSREDRRPKETGERSNQPDSTCDKPGTSNGRPAPQNVPLVPSQAPPDYTSLYGNINPFLPNYGLSLADPTSALLLAQGLVPGIAGGLALPLTGNGLPLAGQLPPVQSAPAQVAEKEEKEDKNKDKHKDSAIKIIEGYSMGIVKLYLRDNKITRQQYSDIMKALMAEFRRSRSIDQLETAETREEIKAKTKELVKEARERNRRR